MAVFVGKLTIQKYLEVSHLKNVRTDVLNHGILFDNCDNYEIKYGQETRISDRFRFLNAKRVLFVSCSKNFTFSILRPANFPNINEVILWSHPCDSTIFHRFPEIQFKINPIYQKYILGYDSYRISTLEPNTFYDLLKDLKEEPLLFGESVKCKF